MPRALTTLQQHLLERLNLVGMEELATRAHAAWSELRPYPSSLTPAEQATMEGALLWEDFRFANQQARAAMSRAG